MRAPELLTRPKGVALVWAAIRPRTLTLSLTPVLVGLAEAIAAGSPPNWPVLCVILLSAMLIQVGTNLYNDAADGVSGNDSAARLGPPRVTALGWAPVAQVRSGAWAAFAGAFAGGGYLVMVGGWPIVGIGLTALLAGWAYSGGRRPISHTPFGEVLVLAFFGWLAVAGAAYLLGGRWLPSAFLSGGVLGLFAAAVLLVNNTRDLPEDVRAGRRTLAILLGEARARRVYAALILAPFIWPLLAGGGWHWLVFLALPEALRQTQHCAKAHGRGWNLILGATARLQMLFGGLLAAGLLLSAR